MKLKTVLETTALIALTSASPSSGHEDSHAWISGGPNDFRGPCPMMNTLANHGFLPRDGRNITKPNAISALNTALNFDVTLAGIMWDQAIIANPEPNATFFTLNDLNRHNVLEHDASISRTDAYFGNNHVFNQSVFDTSRKYWTAETLNAQMLANSKVFRQIESCATNPTYRFTNVTEAFSLGEMAAPFIVFGDMSTVTVKKKFVEYFFENERLPTELGWRKKVDPVTLENITAVSHAIGVATSLLTTDSKSAPSDFQRYHTYADSVLTKFEGECDWHTEFREYHQDDMSNEAIVWRNYNDAWARIGNIRYAWKRLLEKRRSGEDVRESWGPAGKGNKGLHESIAEEDDHLVDAQAILTGSFSKYAAAHADQVRIVSDKSFVRSVARALSRCDRVPFVWFNEDRIGEEEPGCDALTIATDSEALSHVLTQSHDWLSIESTLCKDDDDAGLFFPASILTELPIVCHNSAIRLRGISVDCFPLLRGYHCLVPPVEADQSVILDPWAEFAAACHDLEIFNFGKRGMHCTPLRPERQSISDLAIINSFIGAAISGPHLQEFELSMSPFRVRRRGADRKKEEDLYVVSSILAAIESTQLRKIVLTSVDMSGQALLGLVQSASPRHLTNLYLGGMTLSSGRYAPAMSRLHEIVLLRKENNGSKPNIHFNSLQGAEFGEPSAFDDGNNEWILLIFDVNVKDQQAGQISKLATLPNLTRHSLQPP
ncbi:hypothetical protein yc1106_07687 [Curvularia clavata]|uniref:Heme haloperoxidase family profile domain-containing protein n=1 Tax=Curvularia clavata TaxID=95742 RepID=A0A9Q8ZGR5_CURCL|nr:hypothetical protein yc1106_07687 [Curvularia clavata]